MGRSAELLMVGTRAMSFAEIAEEAHCSGQTARRWFVMHDGSNDQKFDGLKKHMRSLFCGEGYVSLQSLAQKSQLPREVIFAFASTPEGKKYQTEFPTEDGGRTRVMLKLTELNDFVYDLKKFKEKYQAKAEKKAEEKRLSLEELKKAHPLVKDDRFFQESFFPVLTLPVTYDPDNYKE